MAVTLKELGLTSPTGYRVEVSFDSETLKKGGKLKFLQDLYEDVDYGVLSPQTKIKVKVNPSGKLFSRYYSNSLD